MASAPVRIPVLRYPNLGQWVHNGGRMLVIGQAAHPLPVGQAPCVDFILLIDVYI
jgi:hypothetical protein